MSNPYAPPEDRPRASGEQAPAPAPQPALQPSARPVAPDEAHPAPAPGGVRPQPDGPSWAGPRRERPPADPEVLARAVRLAGTFGVLVIASVLVATLPLPWRAASLAFAVLSLVWGGRAFVASVRARARGALPAMLGLGVVVACGWVLVSIVWLSFWHVERANQECLDRALTVTARQQCAQQLDHELDQRTQDLRDRLRSSS